MQKNKLILSIHIPKTAGNSFKIHLEKNFNKDNIMFYYPYSKIAHKAFKEPEINYVSYIKERLEQDKLTIIHGHFSANIFTKYFPNCRKIIWFRDPIERFISTYYHHLRTPNPLCDEQRQIHLQNIDLYSYTKNSERESNLQSRYLANENLSDFDFIGITEKFNESIELFNRTFNCNQSYKENYNKNIFRNERKYIISNKTRKVIEGENLLDIEIYKKTLDQFKLNCQKANLVN